MPQHDVGFAPRPEPPPRLHPTRWRTPFTHVASFLSRRECDALIRDAQVRGLQPSLKAARALDPWPLMTVLSGRLDDVDVDGDGRLTALEVTGAVRAALNAPLFTQRDAEAWLLSATDERGVSLERLQRLRLDDAFSAATRRFFTDLYATSPEKFSRFSSQVPIEWSDLAQSNRTSEIPGRIATLLHGDPTQLSFSDEPLQVIRYRRNGHYAPHSDAGWPGHRPISLLIYLRTPGRGGQTCFLPAMAAESLRELSVASYNRSCHAALGSHGAVCVAPARGDALLWHNEWRLDGSVEVPRPHAACPVIEGEKWVASGWLMGG